MKKVFLPVVLGMITFFSPSIAQAQVYDPFPSDAGCSLVIDYICHGFLPNGSPILYAIPSGYDGRYVLTANKVGDNNLIFMYDNINQQIAAYIYVDNNSRLVPNLNGRPSSGGNLRLLQEVTDESVDILIELIAY